MKFPHYDPETKKEYLCENEYEFRIKSFAEKNQFSLHEDEVIKHALLIKEELINTLDSNFPKSHKIKVQHIKWIEKYLDDTHDFLIQHKLVIPDILENHVSYGESLKRIKSERNKNAIVTNDALWAIADDMRARKEDGEFDTYREAYQWACNNYYKKNVKLTVLKLERAYHKAKSEGLVGKKKLQK